MTVAGRESAGTGCKLAVEKANLEERLE